MRAPSAIAADVSFGLGDLSGNSKKEKWLHALGLQPAAQMNAPQLFAVPPGSTICPYTMELPGPPKVIQLLCNLAATMYESIWVSTGSQGSLYVLGRDPYPLGEKPRRISSTLRQAQPLHFGTITVRSQANSRSRSKSRSVGSKTTYLVIS